jgi:pimeloyl-ACP methyl ester carboxylesterase
MGEDSILRHVSTPAVARDMLSIIDAWDEWRVETGQVDPNTITATSDDGVSQWKSDSLDLKGKLVYWGFSYGTLLGATFAAMFPQRVGRVLLDGVVDAGMLSYHSLYHS